MQTIPYWPFTDPLRPLLDSTGSPQDSSAAFAPDVGPPLTRRRTTAQVEEWSLKFLLNGIVQLNEFEAWFRDDIAGGSKAFVWRRPGTDAVTRWKMVPATYGKQFLGGSQVMLSFSAMLLPGTPWVAPYVPAHSAAAPDWVADYNSDKFWNGESQVTASALSAAISGDYKVLEQRAEGQLWRFATYDEDLPTAAPSGVTWLAGFKA